MKNLIQISMLFAAVIVGTLTIDMTIVVLAPQKFLGETILGEEIIKIFFLPTTLSFSSIFLVLAFIFYHGRGRSDHKFFLGSLVPIAAFYIFYGVVCASFKDTDILFSLAFIVIGIILFYNIDIVTGNKISREKYIPRLKVGLSSYISLCASLSLFFGIFFLLR